MAVSYRPLSDCTCPYEPGRIEHDPKCPRAGAVSGHLNGEVSGRGLLYLPVIETRRGQRVAVAESSAVEPSVWLHIGAGPATPFTILLDTGEARQLGEQLCALADRVDAVGDTNQ